jgi:hypothetical protein
MTPTGTPSNQSAIARIIFSLAHNIVVMAMQIAIQVPECTHGDVRDAHCSLWQHTEEGISKALETRMNERFLSLGQFLQDTQVATRNGIRVSQIDTEGSTSRADLWLLPWISLGAASFSSLCQQRVV